MASIRARIGHYEVIETLGTGSFGKVKLATHVLTGHHVALKFINKLKMQKDNMQPRVEREIAYLKFLRHPHIIKLYEVLHTPTDLVMVLEYAGGDELFHYIAERGRMAEDEARRFFQQLVAAVEYCHRHRIAHRDLKPENLLLDARKNLKIADFGLSNTLRDGDFLQTSCGSPNYAAPEVISGKLYAGPEVDVWSCGVVLYVMLVGRLPFEDEYIPALFQKINGGVFAIPPYLSADARSLLQQMLVVDPLQRITLDGVRQHPFFTKNLPAYLNPLPPLRASALHADDDDDPVRLDPDAVAELAAKLALPRETVLAQLLDSFAHAPSTAPGAAGNPLDGDDEPMAPLRVAYALCVDNRFLWSGRRLENALRDVHWSASPPPSALPASGGAAGRASPAPPGWANSTSAAAALPAPPVPSANADLGHATVFVRPAIHLPAVTSPGGGPSTTPPATPFKKSRSKWHVGIRSRSHPLDVMHELYKALAAVGFDWKVVGPYALRARTHALKLDIQLFKVEAAYYLVDFKLVVPDPTTCAVPAVIGSPPTPPANAARDVLALATPPAASVAAAHAKASRAAGRRRTSALGIVRSPAADEQVVVNVFGFLDAAVRIITELARSG
ncbi:CAMK/CAMKL/AMPK protein kinase [Allomyces macrogynus ATCC 38327]|uniref:non-specific serine/threonine protein kinase n=1 Tax=Allomyces macrogynus (strain ATCC 38327) TaxID=578462 RepID=A0A0L0SSU1_ALLM3|nr:CAMK/CAMKL/AMPK protein kinase [Allomyces macrogynus ATCC 38327]|eukprot:KNE65638.1 CAMK/CAMKL/AMPK protein kinase [Allomyces macrogynus ATCC 38327]